MKYETGIGFSSFMPHHGAQPSDVIVVFSLMYDDALVRLQIKVNTYSHLRTAHVFYVCIIIIVCYHC